LFIKLVLHWFDRIFLEDQIVFMTVEIGHLLRDGWQRFPGDPSSRDLARDLIPGIYDLVELEDFDGARKAWIRATSEFRNQIHNAMANDPNPDLSDHESRSDIQETLVTIANTLYKSTNQETLATDWRGVTNALFRKME
jgi:hypothetical protein